MYDEQEIFSEMETICTNYRGMVIHKTINLEIGIDLFISGFYSSGNSSRNSDLFAFLAHNTSPITFGAKTLALTMILNQHFKDFISEYPDYLSLINRLMEFRNIMAHRKMTLPNDLSEYKKGLVWLTWVKTSRGTISDKMMIIDSRIINNHIIDVATAAKQTTILLDYSEQLEGNN